MGSGVSNLRRRRGRNNQSADSAVTTTATTNNNPGYVENSNINVDTVSQTTEVHQSVRYKQSHKRVILMDFIIFTVNNSY